MPTTTTILIMISVFKKNKKIVFKDYIEYRLSISYPEDKILDDDARVE